MRLTEWVHYDKEKYAIPRMGLKNNGYEKCCMKLAEYEDLEEQGLLIRVPVAVGSKVYEIIEETVPERYYYISEYEVQNVSANEVKYADDWYRFDHPRLFFDRVQAEEKRRELEGKQKFKRLWTPVEDKVPSDDRFVLLSFSNFSMPMIGRYEHQEDGSGNWYIGDCDEEDTCIENDLFVNAWMELPERYEG